MLSTFADVDTQAMDEAAQLRDQFQVYLRGSLEAMSRAVTGMPAGPRRLLVAVEAFWEACYRARAEAQAIAQAAERIQGEQVLMRSAQILQRLLASELKACGIGHAETLAPDLAAEIGAVARAERFADQRLPFLRRRLIGFLESRTGLPSLWSVAA
jgi:hypothetical protein